MSRYKIQAFLFVFVAFMLSCNKYMIVGVLPDISREINASLSSLGYLVTVFALVYAVATPLVTSLTKYFKRHQLLFFLMGIFFIGNTWTALSCQPAFVQNPVSHDSWSDYFPDPGYRQLRGSLGKKEPRFSPGFLPASRLLPSSACQSGP